MKIVQFDKIENDDYGRKAENLSLGRKYVYIPNGFVLSSDIMRKFLEDNNLLDGIKSNLSNVSGKVIPIASSIQRNIIRGNFSTELSEEILEFYETLSYSSSVKELLSKPDDALVSVRNGTWAENSDNIYQLNVLGKNKLLESIKVIFASNFTSGKIRNKDFEEYINPVIIQKMELVQKSGVATSYNPETKDPKEVMIMASFGLGIAKDDEKLGFDEYIVTDYEITKAKIGKQDYAYEKDLDSVKIVKYSLEENSTRQKLGTPHAKEITQTVKKLSRILNTPVLIEWGLKRNKLVIFDIKPVDIELDKPSEVKNDARLEIDNSSAPGVEIVDLDVDEPEDEINVYESYPENFEEVEVKDSEEIINITEDLTIEKDPEPIIDYDSYPESAEEVVDIVEKAVDEEIISAQDINPPTVVVESDNINETKVEEIDSFDETVEKENPEIKDMYELTLNDLEEVREENSSDFAYNFVEERKMSEDVVPTPKIVEEPEKEEENSISFDEVVDDKVFLEEETEPVSETPSPVFEVETDGDSIFDSIGGFDEEEKTTEPLFEPEPVEKEVEVDVVEETAGVEDLSVQKTEPSNTEIVPEPIEEAAQPSYGNTRFEVEEDGDFIFENDEKEDVKPAEPEPVVYKDIFMKEKMRQKPELMVDKAFSEASNVVITCDAAILNRLKDKYKALFNKQPHNYFIEMVNELKTKTNIPFENEIKRVRQLREKYLSDYEPLSSEEIMFCLNISKKFTEEF